MGRAALATGIGRPGDGAAQAGGTGPWDGQRWRSGLAGQVKRRRWRVGSADGLERMVLAGGVGRMGLVRTDGAGEGFLG
jgi:hypothetical protein